MRRGVKRSESKIPSPCVGTCFYDSSGAQCIGCRRTPAEITDWFNMNDEQKQKVLEKINER